jgi:hypothetical protein
MSQYDYECALSGLTQEGADFFDDEMGDLPAGWTKVTLQKRSYNPKWLMIQQVKQMAIQGLLQHVPPELQKTQAWALSLQVEAQFHHLESSTPQFITDEDVAYISDDGSVVESYNELRDMLGLDPVDDDEDLADESHLPHDGEVGDDDDDDDDGDDDDDDE